MGYDSAKKQFVEALASDMFGGYCTQSGSGWNGDTMTFEGTSNGMGDPAGVRDTFAERGPNGLTAYGEMQGPDKKWNKTDEEARHRHRDKSSRIVPCFRVSTTSMRYRRREAPIPCRHQSISDDAQSRSCLSL